MIDFFKKHIGTIQTIFLIAFVICFIPPECFRYISGLTFLPKIFALGRYAFTALFGISLVVGEGDHLARRDWKILLATGLVVVTILISLCVTSTIYLTAALSFLTFFGFVLGNMYFYDQQPDKLLKTYAITVFIYIALQFVTRLLLPDGFSAEMTGDNRVWFLGTKNLVTLYMLLGLFSFHLLQDRNPKKEGKWLKYQNVALFAALDVFVIVNRSTTALIALCIYEGYYLCTYLMRRAKVNNQKDIETIVLVVLFGVFFLFVFVSLAWGHGNYSFFYMLYDITGGRFTFTGRTNIWMKATNLIWTAPWFGHGIEITLHPWASMNVFVYSAHNFVLDYLAKYGVISFVPFVAFFVLTLISAIKDRRNNYQKLCLAAFVATFAGSLLEATETYYTLWAIWMLIYLTQVNSKKELGK